MNTAAQTPRPTPLPVQVDALPMTVRALRRFVVWSYTWKPDNGRPGKWDKPPSLATNPATWASSTNPDTWRTFDEARQAVEDGKCDGLGITLGRVQTADPAIADGNRLAAVDLDRCVESDGSIQPWAQAIVAKLQTYTERSPSGTGIRMLVWTDGLPKGGRKKAGVEMYDSGRYVTLTGQRLPGPTEPQERTHVLAEVHAEAFGTPLPPSRPTAPAPMDLDDRQLIDMAHRAKNGSKFAGLWQGDTSPYDGDDSAADQALCNLLAFWTGRDAARMDRLFRQSNLMRDKWDERHGTQMYGERTIDKAIADCRTAFGETPLVAGSSRITVPTVANAFEGDTAVDVEEDAPPFAIETSAQSFVTRYIDYAQQCTDAPLLAHELMATAALSALAGPTPRIPISTTPKGVRLAIWAMYIVNSTAGRKSTVIDLATSILGDVIGDDALIPWEGSPQGIIQRLQTRDHHSAVFVRDEYSGLLKQMNRGGHLAGLEQTFIRAFDGNRIENIRTKKRTRSGELQDDTDRVLNPYLVKMTAAAWDSFTLNATMDNVLDGFLARFAFVTGEAEPRPLQRMSEGLLRERDRLLAHARAFHARAKQHPLLELDDEVLGAHWDLEQDWQRVGRNHRQAVAAVPSLKRLADTVLKVAGLLALDDERADPPRITLEHFAQARAIGKRWCHSTLRVIDALGRSEFARNCEAVLTSIRKYPQGIGLAVLYRQHRNLNKRTMDDVLAALEMQEHIYRAEGQRPRHGRPALVYVPLLGKK
jgi:hypothetical protein